MLGQIVDRARLYTLIAALETDLRSLLMKWVLPFKDEEDVFGARVDRLRERAGQDGQDPADVSLVQYVDFAESFEVLNRHGEMLPAELARAVKTRTPELAAFVGPRNRVMHARPLQLGDLEYGVRLCVELVDGRLPLPTLQAVVRRLQEDPSWDPGMPPTGSVSLAGVLHNLPLPEYDETGLIGREREVRDVITRLKRRREPVLTLVGEGGMGKTAVAVEALYALSDDGDCPYEAILWSSLKTERLTGEGVESVAGAAYDVLGVAQDLARVLDDDYEGDAQTLGEMLTGIECLVVIDNVESTDAGEIVRFFDAMPDSVSVLLTSRVGVGQLERRLPVGPLDLDAGAKLLRVFAEYRRTRQLSTLDQKVLKAQVQRLRATPLAIRWFVEAVAAGADPHLVISDQSDLLRFCLQTVYDDLSELARGLLGVMYAAGAPVDVGQLAVMTDATADDLGRALQDLQRRSLVETSTGGIAGLHQRYRPTPATAQYLASVDRPSTEILRAAEVRLAELRESEARRQVGALTSSNYFGVVDESQKAVAHLLRKAGIVRKKDPDEAAALIARAHGLSPHYFEIPRLEAFFAAQDDRFDAADELYRTAYAAAPDSVQTARVAYFWAWVKAFGLRDLEAALLLAAEAEERLRVPAASARLALIQIAAGRFEEAEQKLRRVVTSDDPRAVLIARTQLIKLAKERVQRLREQRHVGEAVRVGEAAVTEAGAYLDTGVADRTLRSRALDLALETINAYLDQPSLVEETDISPVLGYVRRHVIELLVSPDLQYWESVAHRSASRRDVPPAVADAMRKLLATVDERQGKEFLRGTVYSFDVDRGYGFITQDRSEERLFFHRQDIDDARTSLLMSKGLDVKFTVRRDEKGLRAGDLTAVFGGADEERFLQGRRLRVYNRKELFAFAHDQASMTSVYIDNRAMPPFEWAKVQEGAILEADLELVAKGPRVRSGTTRVLVE